ncbi:MAG: glutamate mutase L [Candidatus Korobacteraceae bacterium]
MSLYPKPPSPNARVAVDIGSTVVKVALVGEDRNLVSQRFYARDFEAGIVKQVESLLDSHGISPDRSDIRICSSANGGLRVGIVCLTKHFSGAALRNQVLLAGANPVFVHSFDEESRDLSFTDILLVGGGIDCADAAPLEQRLERFEIDKYRHGALVFAGNKYLGDVFRRRFPSAAIVQNPLADKLVSTDNSVLETIRRAYLDDLVYKEGVSELSSKLSSGIRPTPEVVSLGFQRAVNGASIGVIAPCLLLDIGGATTDLHYTVEIVKDGTRSVSAGGSSVGRYVFTDLGIVASRDSLLLQLRSHSRLYEFLGAVLSEDITETYRLFREGEYQPSPELLAHGCLFLAMDRFAQGRGPGLPSGDLAQLSQVILTGGASQGLSEDTAASVVRLVTPKGSKPNILIDRRYEIWVEGISFAERTVAAATTASR